MNFKDLKKHQRFQINSKKIEYIKLSVCFGNNCLCRWVGSNGFYRLGTWIEDDQEVKLINEN